MKDINTGLPIPTGSRAVNWVSPGDIPAWYAPDEAYKDITYATHTSVIQCTYEAKYMSYAISISHKSVSHTIHVSEQAVEQSYAYAINYALQEMYNAFDDGETSLKVIKNLFLTMFGDVANQADPPKSKFNGPNYDMMAWKDEIDTISASVSGGYISAGPFSIGTHQPGGDVSTSLSLKSQRLPGIKEQVKHPVALHEAVEYTLHEVIISLNDSYKWTREEIADWLETLDINITFPVEYTEPNKEVV
jgi:hypothetical protein